MIAIEEQEQTHEDVFCLFVYLLSFVNLTVFTGYLTRTDNSGSILEITRCRSMGVQKQHGGIMLSHDEV